MRIEFTNPIGLFLLALIPAAIFVARHSLSNMTGRRALASTGVRVLIFLLIVMALSGLRVRTASRDIALMFLVDVSASVNKDEQRPMLEFINERIDGAPARDYIGVVAFAREPYVELAPTRKEILGSWRLTEINSKPPQDHTDIASAFRLAAALVPEGATGRFVLISDGNENLGSAAEEARVLRSEEIEIYTRPLSTATAGAKLTGEIAVRDVAAPEAPAIGEVFDVRVTVESTTDVDAALRLFRNDTLIAERAVHLAAGGENVFLMSQRVEEKGFYSYRAEVEALGADSFVQNNSRSAFAVVDGRPKILYVYGDSRPSQAIERVLIEGSFAADIRSTGAVPSSLAGFQDYDLVIFDNVPAVALTAGQMEMVKSYVKELGGGFMMIGGDESFGPGGYYKTPVEDVLPVSLDVRKKKHFPSLAIVLVIDRSGSMSGQKLDLAVEAASATVDFLSERDSAGVIAFDSDAEAIVNLAPVEDKQSVRSRIGSITAGGGTNMYPGLKMAYDWLLASEAQIKHIIVLSDGQSEQGDFAGIARSVREQGMTLTAVAVGDDADVQTMRFLAERGGGRFYATQSPETLPRIFTREAFLASRSTIIEEPFVPRLVRPTQATGGIDWTAAPQLGGYVGTAERDSLSSPAITSLISDKDDPVYAVWQYGLGRAAAFTSDAKPRWAAGWMNWSGFGQFWSQALRDTVRRAGAADLSPSVEIAGGRGHITVEAIGADAQYRNNLQLRAHVIGPDLAARDLTLNQTASGQYEGFFDAASRGAYLVSVSGKEGETAPITGSISAYSPEFNITGTDTEFLSQLSEETGGRFISSAPTGADQSPARAPGDGVESPSIIDLFERRARRTAPHDIWQSLLLAALLLLPLDVGIRRVRVTREQVDEAREWISAKLRRRSVEDVPEGSSGLEQLKDARARVRLSDETGAVIERHPVSPEIKKAAPEEHAPVESVPATARGDTRGAMETPEEIEPLTSRLVNARRKRRG